MVFVAALFVLVLGVGYGLNPPDTLGLNGDIFPALLILVASGVGLALVVRSLQASVPPEFRRLSLRRSRRIVPTEAQLAYARDSSRLVTCPHLEPIERDLRAAGIPVHLRYRNVVMANCHIDEALVRENYAIVPPLYYTPDMPGDRYGEPESALFSCREHNSVIEVVPRSVVQPGIRTYPIARPSR